MLRGEVAEMSPREKITGPFNTSCRQCGITDELDISNSTVVINLACSVHHVLDIITISLAICLIEIESVDAHNAFRTL